MKTIAFFDTKPYDKLWFEKLKTDFGFEFKYLENRLNEDTALLAVNCDGVVAFVNDEIGEKTINKLYDMNIKIIALRSAGFNNVDFNAAYGKIHIVRVPDYSPYAVAEHAMALLLTLNRKTHRAFNRTREFNFSLNGLTGFDLNGKTIGVIGTGKIGKVFLDICKGFNMKILAYDPYPIQNSDIEYVSLEELCKKSDIISLHCPLNKSTYHIINEENLSLMKEGVIIINTSRGALIDSEALLNAIKNQKIGGAGLDVYEEESELFFEDFSNTILQDDILARLISMPNVIVTSHQAFLTKEALYGIARVTLRNLKEYFDNKLMTNEICYQCQKTGGCHREQNKRCF